MPVFDYPYAMDIFPTSSLVFGPKLSMGLMWHQKWYSYLNVLQKASNHPSQHYFVLLACSIESHKLMIKLCPIHDTILQLCSGTEFLWKTMNTHSQQVSKKYRITVICYGNGLKKPISHRNFHQLVWKLGIVWQVSQTEQIDVNTLSLI